MVIATRHGLTDTSASRQIRTSAGAPTSGATSLHRHPSFGTPSVGPSCLSGVMHLTAALEELTEAELLDHADEVARTQRECEAQVLRIAAQVAILNNPDAL